MSPGGVKTQVSDISVGRLVFHVQLWYRLVPVYSIVAKVDSHHIAVILIEGVSMEKSVAPAGFDPATAGLWAQHANHCATVLPVLITFLSLRERRKYFSTNFEIFIPNIKLLHILREQDAKNCLVFMKRTRRYSLPCL